MELLAKKDFGKGLELIAFKTTENGQLKYYYNLNQNGKNVAFIIGRVDLEENVFVAEQMFAAVGRSKRETSLAFVKMIPEVERILQNNGINSYWSITNERMARFLQKNHHAHMEPHGKSFKISKTIKRPR